MATWEQTGLLMLRAILNDAGCGTGTYTTKRLQDLLITAAYFLPIDINFTSTYTVDVEANTISPDPISTTADGQEFINFMVLRAACLADEGNFRTNALMQGVKARCGPAVIELNKYGEFLAELLTAGPCAAYETLKKEYNFSYEGGTIIRAVMSPFASNDFDPGTNLRGHGFLDTNNPHRGGTY
jgi:hypothetical protein